MKPVEWLVTLAMVCALIPVAVTTNDLLVFALPLLVPFTHGVRKGEY